MEIRPDLVTGHARTANARIRTRNAWEDISRILNSVGNGCIKDWKLWSKYWKDKKSAVKRKANMAETARQRTGAGIDTQVVELSHLEQRILTIAGGVNFAMGDRHLAINPFPEQGNIAQPPARSEPSSSAHSQSILLQGIPGLFSEHIGVTTVENEPSHRDERIEVFVRDGAVESPDAFSLLLPTVGDEAMSIINQEDNETVTLSENDRSGEERTIVRESPPGGGARRRILLTTPSPHRRLLQSSQRQGGTTHSSQGQRDVLVSPRAARGVSAVRHRRPLRRSPPSQRRSEMANLTERFIAVENRRVDVEHALARSLETFAQVLNKLTDIAQQMIQTRQQI